jgi:aspartate 1-decarboxylase
MLAKVLKAKIHRARVTGADIDYEGSITIDPDFLDQVGLLPYELVQIYDITNGVRLETYLIEGERGSRQVVINGAAARIIKEGDLIIIASYALLSPEEMAYHQPRILILDESNRVR